jgi:hypothetical protein
MHREPMEREKAKGRQEATRFGGAGNLPAPEGQTRDIVAGTADHGTVKSQSRCRSRRASGAPRIPQGDRRGPARERTLARGLARGPEWIFESGACDLTMLAQHQHQHKTASLTRRP